MCPESEPPDGDSGLSRRALFKSVGAGLSSLSLFGMTGRASRPEAGSTGGTAETRTTVEEPVDTTVGFDSGTITTSETTTISCEWDLGAQTAPGRFHTLALLVQSANIDSPETAVVPFAPDSAWEYDITDESVPIRGATYRWSVRDRWTTPGRYRVEAIVSPYLPGDITAVAGPYGGDAFGWSEATLSVEW
ncbi:hypothetical protein GRX03_11660 [Halovenus sp. WSH3]|uniref:Uncharacterized protein n=1 Tax=Halovenus carboxidivorans TaxID=2692199 RepID=A0A6B0T7S1_9EURY|nr:hypothetical protein [Halovenus carboxidivorans]MXR52256.1 hypothetical protein [Halovenus carboxidivorans]